MKKLLQFLTFLMSAFTASASDNMAKHENIKKSDILIIDVRTLSEYNSGHIDKAILIPYNEIGDKISSKVKNKNTPIAVYCLSGSRAKSAVKTLENLGYTNVVNYGGISSARKILNNKK